MRKLYILFLVTFFFVAMSMLLSDRQWGIGKTYAKSNQDEQKIVVKTVNVPQENKKPENVINDNIEKEVVYVVKRGDTLSRISRKYNVTVDAIIARNPEIENANLIFVNQEIKLGITDAKANTKKTKKTEVSCECRILILKDASERTGIPWEILAGLSKQESQFGKFLVGDSGKSFGPFHINLKYHPNITIEQAMNWEWSANWAADYLVELGAHENLFRALRLWNGRENNPATLNHAKRVVYHAVNTFGFEGV